MLNIIPTLTVMRRYEEYEKMVRNYVASNSTVFRCNTTRFDNDTYAESLETLQEIYFKMTGRHFETMLDVPCPKEKVRIEFREKTNDISIKKGTKVTVTNSREEYCGSEIYADIEFNRIDAGERITLGDGDLFLKVIAKKGNRLECVAENDGVLGYRKALYTKEIAYKESEEETQKKNTELIERVKPKYVAMSFTETAGEIKEFLSGIECEGGYKPAVIAKIETQRGIDNLDEILAETKSVMIARGDLALSAGYERLYENQNLILKKGKEAGATVYVASEIINSLVEKPAPTRPEVCDLANLISSGAENIILSGPIGRYDNYNTAVRYIEDMYKIYH